MNIIAASVACAVIARLPYRNVTQLGPGLHRTWKRRPILPTIIEFIFSHHSQSQPNSSGGDILCLAAYAAFDRRAAGVEHRRGAGTASYYTTEKKNSIGGTSANSAATSEVCDGAARFGTELFAPYSFRRKDSHGQGARGYA